MKTTLSAERRSATGFNQPNLQRSAALIRPVRILDASKPASCRRSHGGLLAVLLCVLALLPLGAQAATNELSTALQQGLFEEEANRNLPAALEAYEKVAKQFDQNRALAATAIFRLGEVNRKLGKTNEAAAFYQRILREFSDQDTLAKHSQQNLAGMGMAGEGDHTAAEAGVPSRGFDYFIQSGDTLSRIASRHQAVGVKVSVETILKANPGLNGARLRVGQKIFIPDPTGSNPASGADSAAPNVLSALREAEAEAAALKAEVKQLTSASPQDRRQIIQQNHPNPVLTKLLEDLAAAQQQLVIILRDYSPEHPQAVTGRRLTDKINSQIEDQLQGVLTALEARRDLAVARAERLREQMGKTTVPQSAESAAAPITTVLDEEETEIRRIQAMIQNSPDLINAPSVAGLGGDTPLAIAASKGQLRVARFLLDNGARVNQPTSASGREPYLVQGTPLHQAASAGHRAMVELLLERGANVNARSKDGYTALHVVAVKGFQAVAEALLNGKADIDAGDKGGSTPLHLASRFGHSGLVGFLIAKGANVNASASGGMTPLMLASDQGHLEVVRQLLAAKANPDAQSDQGRTALSVAAEGGHLDVVKALLAAKADPNAGKVDLPLHCAIKSKSADIVEALLKAGADANRVGKVTWNLRFPNGMERGNRDGFEVTPLAEAMTYGQLDVIKLLLDHKADPNGKRVDGSPLILAAVNDAEIMRAFLDAGANPNVDDGTPWLRTPLLMANDPKITTMLLEVGAKTETRHRSICDASDLGMTPLLIHASCWTNIAVVEALLKGSADVNARTVSGMTALHFAAANKNEELMELLIGYKADVNARDNQGLTPLDYAKGKHLQPPLPPAGMAVPQSQLNPESSDVADLLRQHGGLADLPKLDRIEVTRPGSFRKTVFLKGTNDWNRFTLLELLAIHYGFLSAAPSPSSASEWADPHNFTLVGSLKFPDLDRIVIFRPGPVGAESKETTVNLTKLALASDCSGNIPLEWGDVVRIPEKDHPIDADWQGLGTDVLGMINRCLTREVRLSVGGQSTNLVISPQTQRGSSYAVGPYGRIEMKPPQAMLRPVLVKSGLLRISSDLTRVKVTRRESANATPRVWIVDCSDPNNALDLWLRDGDVIEVPEK